MQHLDRDEIFNFLWSTGRMTASYIRSVLPNITKSDGRYLINYYGDSLDPIALYSTIKMMIESELLYEEDGIKYFLSYCYDLINQEEPPPIKTFDDMLSVLRDNREEILGRVFDARNSTLRDMRYTALNLYLLKHDRDINRFVKSRTRDAEIEDLIFQTKDGETRSGTIATFQEYANALSYSGACLSVDPYFKVWSLMLPTLPMISGTFTIERGKLAYHVSLNKPTKEKLGSRIGHDNVNDFEIYIKPFLDYIVPEEQAYRKYLLYDNDFTEYKYDNMTLHVQEIRKI